MKTNSPWRRTPMACTDNAREQWRGGQRKVKPPLAKEKVVRIYLAEGLQKDIAKEEKVLKSTVSNIKRRRNYKYYTVGLDA